MASCPMPVNSVQRRLKKSCVPWRSALQTICGIASVSVSNLRLLSRSSAATSDWVVVSIRMPAKPVTAPLSLRTGRPEAIYQ